MSLEHFRIHYPILATIVFEVSIVVAHLIAPDSYDWRRNTISDLGAQGYERNGIMRTGFLAFGVILAVGCVISGPDWRRVPILLYGSCVALAGVFCTKPFSGAAAYSVTHASLHSAFAQAAGVLFSVGLVLHIVFASTARERFIHAAFLVGVIGLSAAFGSSGAYPGVMQRLLYLLSFIWLVRWYRP